MAEVVKCSGCGGRKNVSEYAVVKEVRRKCCIACLTRQASYKCEHGRRKSRCKECGGSAICEHGRVQSSCNEGECNGSDICSHGRQKRQCKECGGSQICEHNRRKTMCKEGDCNGASICEHNRQKNRCIEGNCNGSGICSHGRQKGTCKEGECNGTAICSHGRRKNACKVCSPKQCIINIVRKQVWRCFKQSTLAKTNHSIAYIGCDADTLRTHIENKMTDGMAADNIHYDHIKPVSRFNLEDDAEMLECCHFTNLQPLLAKDNLEKHNKWTDADEVFWRENIIYKPAYTAIYYSKS